MPKKLYPFRAKPVSIEKDHWVDMFESEEEYIKSFVPEENYKDGYVYGYLLDDWIVGTILEEEGGCFCPEFWIKIDPDTLDESEAEAYVASIFVNAMRKEMEEQGCAPRGWEDGEQWQA